MPENDLSQQSFCDLLRLFCHRQRTKDVAVGFVFLGLSIIYVMVVYYWTVDETLKECAQFVVIGCLGASGVWFVIAGFRSPLAWVRGEPEDMEILSVCIKRCFCCGQRPSAITFMDQMPRPDPENINTSSTNINRSVTSILPSLPQSSSTRAPIDSRNTESDDSGIRACLKCVSCPKSSNLEASESTAENLAHSSTDSTDRSSSEEDMEMVSLNPKQRGPSSQQIKTDVANSAGTKILTFDETTFDLESFYRHSGTMARLRALHYRPHRF